MYGFVGSHSKVSLGGVFNGVGEGVYAVKINPSDGSVTTIDTAALPDPTWLAISRSRSVLFAASHSVWFEGKPGAGVTAFAIGADGKLTRLNSQRIIYPHITMITLDAAEQFLLAASSLGGAVSVLPIETNGRLGPASDGTRFEGKVVIDVGETPDPSPVPGVSGMTITRMPEYGPTTIPHSIGQALVGNWVLIADIGASAIGVLGYDSKNGHFTSKRRFALDRKAGPRILAFHPNGHTFYSVNELDSTVSAYELDINTGELDEVQHVRALPDGVSVPNTSSGIAIHPNGRFLWASNRGHDSVTTFAIDAAGRLTFVNCVPAQGKFPIHLGVSPDARLLFVSTPLSRSLAAFAIDDKTGIPIPKAVSHIPSTCTVFLS